MEFKHDDGGRHAAGFAGRARDCVCRAVCIAAGLPYQQVYDRLAEGNAGQRRGRKRWRACGKKTASDGILTHRKWFKDYMVSLGFAWQPTMKIGSGCKVHMRSHELPTGRLVVRLSHHMAAVIDGVLHDNHNSSRDGKRCVYGYWKLS